MGFEQNHQLLRNQAVHPNLTHHSYRKLFRHYYHNTPKILLKMRTPQKIKRCNYLFKLFE